MFHSKCYITKEVTKWKTEDNCGQIWTYPAVHIFHGTMPENIIKDVSEYCSKTNNDLAAEAVVANMRCKQSTLDMHDPLMEEFITKMLQNVCTYINKCEQNYGKGSESRSVDIDNIWDGKMVPGDYNSLHFHETESKEGVSSIFYLKVPDNGTDSDHLWPNGSDNEVGSVQKDEIIGHGLLKFRWGLLSPQNSDSFSCPDHVTIIPKIGHFYIFPSSLHHEIMPFYENKDRWSVQINFNCWSESESSTQIL